MAPNFLSKFVKAATPTSAKERNSRDRSVDSPRSSVSPAPARNRASSTPTARSSAEPSVPPPVPPIPAGVVGSVKGKGPGERPSIAVVEAAGSNGRGSMETFETGSSHLNVTVVPPSPLVRSGSLHSESDQTTTSSDHLPNSAGQFVLSAAPKRRTTPSPTPDDPTPTQTPTTPRPPSRSRPTTPTPASAAPPPAAVAAAAPTPATSSHSSSAPHVHKQPSTKSLNRAKQAQAAAMPPPSSSAHLRAATAPPAAFADDTPNGTGTGNNANPNPLPNEQSALYTGMSPIVESPTNASRPDLPDRPYTASSSPETYTSPNGQLSSSRTETFDTRSIMSANGNGEKDKKLPWRKGSTSSRKPTGLASAIAASGLAMANPTLSAAQQAAHQATINNPPPGPTTVNGARRKSSGASSPPYLTRSPPGSSSHVKSRSADISSPRSSRSKRSGSGSARSAKSPRRLRTPSVSVASDGNSEYYPEDRPEYYSGLDEGSSGDESSDEDDDLDLDLEEDDIPVTGFAVASNKRNADFHELFPTIPEGDYLIEDYGCALQREILIQGRLYISENHICFHANIFGWITDLSIPIYEITSLEKKMTAFVIPNAIQITTRQMKYTFASFLSRDTTYDVIYNIWRVAKPDDMASIEESPTREHVQETTSGAPPPAVKAGAQRKVTQCACGKEGKHYSETAMDVVLPGTPDRIHNLMFASGFIKDFMVSNQKLMDIQMSDWTPISPGSKLLARNFSYIKPLNGSLGPKQTKCELRDETAHIDPEDYISMVTTTRTPDVPSGGVFSVKTRTCLMWASAVSTKVIVTTQVEWTGRSFIKSIIERSAIDGQKTYHIELEKAMRAYIQEHKSEFIPEGLEASALVEPEPEEAATADEKKAENTEEEKKQREHERNQRGLQWAWDTFEGAYEVARRSTIGALELVKDAWEQSTATAILYFVIVLLVFSNLYTLTRMGSREEAGRRKEMKKIEEREQWVQGVVTALWEELSAGKRDISGVHNHYAHGQAPASVPVGGGNAPVDPSNWRKEVEFLHQALDNIEGRVKSVRETLAGFEGLNTMD